MPKSLLRGDYSLLLAVESSSRPDSWYRVLTDRQLGALSCDCPPFIFNRQQNAQGERACPHTQVGQRLAAVSVEQTQRTVPTDRTTGVSSFITATREQWPGLRGTWSIEERDATIKTTPYRFVLLRLELGNGGGIATGTVAFSRRHTHTQAHLASRVAGWAGYAIAAEVARLGGLPMAGQLPDHFKVPRREGRRATPASAIGLLDILRVADQVDLGDGLRPAERAEKTLRLFLGETLYQQIERQGFLDICSVHYARSQRVYRIRRDPQHQRERRVRIFEHGRYIHDYCLVRGQDVPEADHFLTLALGLLSDEKTTLSVMGRHNIFSPYSDSTIHETIPVHWQARGSVDPPVHQPG
jgi:hypothetical protein